MNRIVGCARVRKVAAVTDDNPGQSVTVTDAGQYVKLSISTSSFPAELTPEEARHIANAMTAAADTAEKFKRPR